MDPRPLLYPMPKVHAGLPGVGGMGESPQPSPAQPSSASMVDPAAARNVSSHPIQERMGLRAGPKLGHDCSGLGPVQDPGTIPPHRIVTGPGERRSRELVRMVRVTLQAYSEVSSQELPHEPLPQPRWSWRGRPSSQRAAASCFLPLFQPPPTWLHQSHGPCLTCETGVARLLKDTGSSQCPKCSHTYAYTLTSLQAKHMPHSYPIIPMRACIYNTLETHAHTLV